MSNIRKCSCGNDQFFAHQRCYNDIVVDENNNFQDNLIVYDAESPYGPYQCTSCDKEYDELNDLCTVDRVEREDVPNRCYDCGIASGMKHKYGCAIEICPLCAEQALSCSCQRNDEWVRRRAPWTGEWPGIAECREFGWYVRYVPGQGMVRCDKDDTGATADLARFSAWFNQQAGGSEDNEKRVKRKLTQLELNRLAIQEIADKILVHQVEVTFPYGKEATEILNRARTDLLALLRALPGPEYEGKIDEI